MSGATFVPGSIVFVTVSAFGLCVCFLTVFQFGVFLFNDGFRYVDVHSRLHAEGQDAANPYMNNLILDLLLIGAFILQHSLMACRLWKDFIQWLGLDVVERSLYILATSASLQVLISYWQPLLPDYLLWSVDIDSRGLRFIFGMLCFLGWLCVVGVVMVLDYAELVGIKQVYYYVMDLDPPILMKSREYQRLFKNFRHPVLTGLLIILWVVPVMSVSRLVLVLSLTLYTCYGHGLDMQDYDYICLQHRLKKVAQGSPLGYRRSRTSSVSYG